jgi:hypothetical protein
MTIHKKTNRSNDENEQDELNYVHRRALDGESLAHVHRRLDSNTEILNETRERIIIVHGLLVEHIKRDEEMKPALEELTTLWKGSKLIIPILSAIAIGLAGTWAWFKQEFFK